MEVGGFPTESICEDTLLSFKLRGKRWKTLYLDESLSIGLNAEGLSEFLLQRARWNLGGIQIAVFGWRALAGRLALRQRMDALASIGRGIVHPVLRVFWMLAPSWFWLTGTPLIRAPGGEMVRYALPLVAYRMMTTWMSRGALLPIVSDSVWLLTGPLILRATVRGLRGSTNIKFEVTPKGISRSRTTVHWRPLLWLGTLAALLVLAMAYGAANPRDVLASSPFLLWSLYSTFTNLTVILVAMTPCVERPKYRGVERFLCSVPVAIKRGAQTAVGRLRDISLTGAMMESESPLNVGDEITFRSSDLEVSARVARIARPGCVGLDFNILPNQKSELVRYVLCSGKFVSIPNHWRLGSCAKAMFRRAFA
jgi:cellulose synthase (UDP-forming)